MNTPNVVDPVGPSWAVRVAVATLMGIAVGVMVLIGLPGTASAQLSNAELAAAVSSTEDHYILADQHEHRNQPRTSESAGTACAQVDAVDASYLPVNRWAGGTGKFHWRLGTTDVAEKLQRGVVQSTMFDVGNFAWVTTTGMVETAVNFCVLDAVGGTVDRAAAKLGGSIMSSALVALFFSAAVIVWIWRIGRVAVGGGGSSMIAQKAVIVALFGIMLAGSAASEGGTRETPEPYKPGMGSPGWFITTIDRVVAASASSLVYNAQDQVNIVQGAETGPEGRGDVLGCGPYVKAMKDIYIGRNGGGQLKASAVTPLLLSSMWESSGLELWKKAQFGTDNHWGDYVYCRMLEYNVSAPLVTGDDTPLTEQASVQRIMRKVLAGKSEVGGFAGGGEVNVQIPHDGIGNQYLAWRYSSSNSYRDRIWVGWAVCAREGYGDQLIRGSDSSGDTEITHAVCQAFFEERDWDGKTDSAKRYLSGVVTIGEDGGLEWGSSDTHVNDVTPAARDFLLTLHGNRTGSGFMGAFIYMVSAVMIAVVFIMISIAILLAKIMGLVMMISVFGALLIALLPSMGVGKVVDWAKSYFGLALFAWGAQLLLSLMALLTGLLSEVGQISVPGGPGSIMHMMWIGFAPILAVMGLNMMFKKMGLPSLLSPTSGMAWGKMAAAGAVGGAAAGGTMLAGQRLLNRGKRMAGQKAKQAGSGLIGSERKNRMQPGPGTSAGRTGAGSGRSGLSPVGTGAGEDEHTRAEVARASQEERRAAKEWATESEGQEAVAAERQKMGRGIGGHFNDRAANIREQFRDKPLRTGLKYGAVGSGLLAMSAVTGGLPALAIGAGMLAGRSGVSKTLRTLNPLDRSRSEADTINAYRAHVAAEQARLAAEEEAAASVQQPQPGREPNGEGIGPK